MSQLRLAMLEGLRLHVRIVRRNRVGVACVCATFAAFLSLGTYHQLLHLIGYLLAVWLGAFITDLAVIIKPKPAIGFPIKQKAIREALVAAGFTLAGFVPLAIRFSRLWPIRGVLERSVFIAGLVLFTFPIGLVCVYLLRYRYKPRELGLNLRYWYLPLLIHALFGVITLIAAPEKSHWESWIHTYGFWGLLLTGLIEAALPEEFTRMLLQTRLSVVFRNSGLGFFAATFLWASMHMFMFRSQAPQWSLWRAIVETWGIIPVGLLWGYITHRTKSLFPSVVLHGFNYWGLQNF